MKSLICLGLLVVVVLSSSLKNTTDFWSKELGYNMSEQAYSGYQDIDWYYKNKSASIYYSLWQGTSQSLNNHDVPLIIWLQGGPGGSSQFGCFNEVGPIFINNFNGTNKPVQSTWAWNHFGHLMCVDQPINVGFSINNGNPTVDNTPQAADHFINFLVNFFKSNPWDLGKNPLYLAG